MFVCFLQPLGLAGAALMAVSSAATYIMWRYRSQEPTVQSSTATEEQPNPRYSVFIWHCVYLNSARLNPIIVQNCRKMKQSWPKEILHSGEMTGVFKSVKVYINFTEYYYMPDVYWTVHHCDNWRIKNQLNATYYFIVLHTGSTCFGQYYAHHHEFATVMLITTLVVSFLVCCLFEVRYGYAGVVSGLSQDTIP